MDGESRSPLFYRHVAAGAVSAVVASALTYPLDVAKTVAQAGVAQASVAHAVVAQTGAVQGSTIAGGPGGGSSGGLARSGTAAASRAAATSGLNWRSRAAFTGFSPHIAGHLPSLAARYTTYHLAAAYQMGESTFLPSCLAIHLAFSSWSSSSSSKSTHSARVRFNAVEHNAVFSPLEQQQPVPLLTCPLPSPPSPLFTPMVCPLGSPSPRLKHQQQQQVHSRDGLPSWLPISPLQAAAAAGAIAGATESLLYVLHLKLCYGLPSWMPISPPQAALAGAIAGATESLLSTPFDLLRTRLLLATPLLPPVPPSHPISLPSPSIRIHRPSTPSQPTSSSLGKPSPSEISPNHTSSGQSATINQSSNPSQKSRTGSSLPKHKLPHPHTHRQTNSRPNRPHRTTHKRTFVSSSSPPPTVLTSTQALHQRHFSAALRGPTTPPPPNPPPPTTFSLSLARYPWTPVPSPYLPASSPWEAARAGVRAEGAAQLWRGLRAGVTRDSLFGAVFFGGWVTIEEGLRELEELQRRKSERDGEEEQERTEGGGVGGGDMGRGSVGNGYWYALTQGLEAAVAAAVASVVSHPFDCAKTRTQATVLPKGGEGIWADGGGKRGRGKWGSEWVNWWERGRGERGETPCWWKKGSDLAHLLEVLRGAEDALAKHAPQLDTLLASLDPALHSLAFLFFL
ncbi:unnamed protein product [Closterium sp. NIES-65]|nr:unnamed protein product [Closterium sp. NIES-65]